MGNDTNFFREIVYERLRELDRPVTWLAARLGYAPSTVTRWLEGYTRPRDPRDIIRVAELLNIYDRAERQAMLEALGYAYVEGAQSASEETAPEESMAEAVAPEEIVAEESTIAESAIEDVTNEEDVTGESAAEENAILTPTDNYVNLQAIAAEWFSNWGREFGRIVAGGGSWDEKLLRLLGATLSWITARRLLLLLLTLGLWWLTGWLVLPILRWSSVDLQTQWMASIRFAVGTVLVPLLLTSLLLMDTPRHLVVNGARAMLTLFLLHFAGALVGVYISIVGIVVITLVWFYWRNGLMNEGFVWWLLLVPLILGYAIARRIPTDRQRMYNKIQSHPVDRLVALVFVLLGPLTATFLFMQREMVQDPGFGIAFFVVAVAFLLWEARRAVTGISFVLLFGVFLPCTILLLPALLPGQLGQIADPIALSIFTVYAVGQGVLLSLLVVRGGANIAWFYLFVIFLLDLLTLAVMVQDLQIGLYFLGGVVGIFLVMRWLGQSYLRSSMQIHDSFWVMQPLFIVSLYTWAAFLGWSAFLLFIVAASGLTLWALSATTSNQLMLATEEKKP